MNPTIAVLEERVAAMEGGIVGLAVASGMSAITYAIQCICTVGDNIVSTSQLYGGTYNLFAHALPNQGIETHMIANDDFAGFEAEIRTKHGVPLIVYNTVATPFLCRPIEHGAAIVVHSLTKYIGGHGTSIGGIIVDSGQFYWVANKERFPVLNQPDPSYHGVVYTNALGQLSILVAAELRHLETLVPLSTLPIHLYILTGLETLGLRMERHCENAEKLAEYLNHHLKVSWVNYAALADSPYNATCKIITSGKASGILSFGIKVSHKVDSKVAGVQFIDALQMILRLVKI
ncbi:MAG: PLP-dependent transferase [Paraglaciecola sp.]|uniref:PLP-dependent transferase n=1 Tax=Paraglaciecola sp. TaxID=1920173 RepID=UPI00329899D3